MMDLSHILFRDAHLDVFLLLSDYLIGDEVDIEGQVVLKSVGSSVGC